MEASSHRNQQQTMERGPVDHAPSASLVMAAVIKKAEEEAPPRIFATSALDVLQCEHWGWLLLFSPFSPSGCECGVASLTE